MFEKKGDVKHFARIHLQETFVLQGIEFLQMSGKFNLQ